MDRGRRSFCPLLPLKQSLCHLGKPQAPGSLLAENWIRILDSFGRVSVQVGKSGVLACAATLNRPAAREPALLRARIVSKPRSPPGLGVCVGFRPCAVARRRISRFLKRRGPCLCPSRAGAYRAENPPVMSPCWGVSSPARHRFRPAGRPGRSAGWAVCTCPGARVLVRPPLPASARWCPGSRSGRAGFAVPATAGRD